MISSRVLFAVVDYFPYGGMQRSFRRIAEEVLRRGHRVHLATATWEGDVPAGAERTAIDVRGWTNHGKNVSFGRALARFIRSERAAGRAFDLVVGFTKVPGLDVYYGGDPCYRARLETEGRLWLSWVSPRHRTLVALERSVFGKKKRTEALLIAHRERELFKAHYGTPDARFHLLPPGVEKARLLPNRFDRAARAAARRELGAADGDVVLLNIAAHFRTKGVDRIVAAMAALDPVVRARMRLFVVGGDDAEPLRTVAERLELGDRVRFFGARQDVGLFYRAADLLVHPARIENTGTTLVEALIAGLPVLTTTVCGYASHVREADAGRVLDEPFEAAVFEDALEHIVTDDAARDAFARNAVAYAERTDLSSLITAAADAIEAALVKKRGRSAGR